MDDAVRKNESSPLAATGVAGLDDILCGGLTPHRVYLVEGDPGAGKTTLGLQFLLEGRDRGEKGVYVALSETRDELLAVANSHGWSLEGIEICELGPTEESLSSEEENTMFYPSELELAETVRAVLKRIDEIRPSRVVFDSLSEIRLLAQSSLRYRRQILALKVFFIGKQCTVVLLDDRTAEINDLQLQSIAHGVLALERKSPEFGVMQRRLQVFKMRGREYRAGFHDYVIERGGLKVFPRLLATDHAGGTGIGQIQSDIPELDALMCGGLDEGTSTLLMGPAGSGKSTISTQYAIAAAKRGERVAFFLFDESEKTLLKRSRGIGLHLEEHIKGGRIAIRQVDPGQMSAGEFVHYVRTEVESQGAKMVVIDSLNGYLNAMPEARFLTLALHEMLSYLGRRGVNTLLVVAQQGLIGAMTTPVDASYLADTVVLLRYFEAAGQVRQAISVLKRRSGDHERSIREITISQHGVSIGPPLDRFQGVLTGVPQFIGAHPSQSQAAPR